MNRMLALFWAVGLALFATQAQASAPKSSEAGVVRKADVSNTQRKSGHVRSHRRNASSATKSRHAHARRASHSKRHAQRSKSYHRRSAQSKRYRSSASRSAHRGSSHNRVAGHQRSAKRKAAVHGHALTGIASYYWQPQRVASGGWFNPKAMTAAHKTLPFGTRVRVTHARNGRSVDVTINDRGPYIAGLIIDLSSAAAGVIGMKGSGIAQVKVEVLGR